jgi:hypothetical protein
MRKQYRNTLVLSGCQATLQTSGATMIAVTGLAGYALATDKGRSQVLSHTGSYRALCLESPFQAHIRLTEQKRQHGPSKNPTVSKYEHGCLGRRSQ